MAHLFLWFKTYKQGLRNLRNHSSTKGSGARFKSLNDVKNRLDVIARRGNSHTRDYKVRINEENGEEEFARIYDDVKMPSRVYVACMIIEHPNLAIQEVGNMIRHRIDMRHFFPDKYKTPALARGDEYLPDEMEEYKESMLDAIEKERLKSQRIRRARIGNITQAYFDYTSESPTDRVFTYQVSPPIALEVPFSESEYISLLEMEKDI